MQSVIAFTVSAYVNTHPLARGDLIFPADQSISKRLAQIGQLLFVKNINIFCEAWIINTIRANQIWTELVDFAPNPRIEVHFLSYALTFALKLVASQVI